MPMNISKEIVELITLVRQAFLPLRDKSPIKNNQELAAFNDKSGDQDRANNKEAYSKNASRILDHFVFHATEIFLNQAKNYKEAKFIPEAGQYINFGLTVNEQFNKENITSAASYLSEHRVPEFMDDEILYQKMLWIEWWLVRLKEQTQKQNVPAAVAALLINELKKRFVATERFLNDYAKIHPDVIVTLQKHRDSYKKKTHQESFQAAYAISGKGILPQPAADIVVNQAPANLNKLEIKIDVDEDIEAIKGQLVDVDVKEIKRFVREELPSLIEKMSEHETFVTAITKETPITTILEIEEELRLFQGQLEEYQQELTVFNNTDEEFVLGSVQIASLLESIQSLQIHYESILSNLPKAEAKEEVVKFDAAELANKFTVNETTNVVIVGAGPTGLWVAIQIKLANPGVDIQILERYEEFKRGQILRLDLNEIVTSSLHKKLIALAAERKLKKNNNLLNIPIKIFQKFLEKEAIALRVHIHKNVEYAPLENEGAAKRFQLNLDQIRGLFPKAKIIIGADGSHSVVRQNLFGSDEVMLTTQAVQYLAEIKYSVVLTERTRKLDYISQGYATEKLAGFRCDETVNINKENGTAAITLRFIIDKDTFESLGDINFKNALTNLNYMPVALQNAANVWLKVREFMTDEKIIANTVAVTKFPLLIYRSKQFTQKLMDGVYVFLVGDSAFGVPYFRALNAGLHCATKLATLFTDSFQKNTPLATTVARYEKSVEADYNAEYRLAITKDFGLELWKALVRINHAVPLDLNRWDSEKQKLFNQEHNIFIQTALNPYKVSAKNKAPLTPIEKRAMGLTKELIKLTDEFIKIKENYRKSPATAVKQFNENQNALNDKNDLLRARIIEAMDAMVDEMQKACERDVNSPYLNYFLIQVTRFNGLFLKVTSAEDKEEGANLLMQLDNTMIQHTLLSVVAQKSLTYRHIPGKTLPEPIFRDPVRETVKGKIRYGYHDKIASFIDHYGECNKHIFIDTQTTQLGSLMRWSPFFSKPGQQKGQFLRARDENSHREEEKCFLDAWTAVKAGEPLTQQQRQLFTSGQYYRGNMPVTFRLPTELDEKANTDKFNHYHVGHAAELIQTGAGLIGFDLVNYNLAPLLYPRNTQPGITTDCYPMMPVVCISHNHYDHLDKETLIEALRGMNPLIIVAEGDGKLLKEWGFQHVLEFASWNDAVEMTVTDQDDKQKTLIIRALPAKHASNRSLTDSNVSLFMGHMLQEKGKNFVTIVTGDTAVLDEEHYQQLEDFLVKNDLHVASACIASGPDRPRQHMECTHQSTADAITLHAHFNVINTRIMTNRRINVAVNNEEKAPKTTVFNDFSTSGCDAISYHQGCYRLGTLNLNDVDGTLTRTLAVLASYRDSDLSFVYADLQHQNSILTDLAKKTSEETRHLSNYYFAMMDVFERVALLETLKQYMKIYAGLKPEETKAFTASFIKEHICRHLYLPQPGCKMDLNAETKETFGFQYQRLIVNRDPSQQKICEYELYLDEIILLCRSNTAFKNSLAAYLSGQSAINETTLMKTLLILYVNKTPYNYFATAPKQKRVQEFLNETKGNIAPQELRKELIILRGKVNQWKTSDESQRSEGAFETIMLMLVGLLDRDITQFDRVFEKDLLARYKATKTEKDKPLFGSSTVRVSHFSPRSNHPVVSRSNSTSGLSPSQNRGVSG